MTSARVTALDLWRSLDSDRHVLSSGCETIDGLLGGGFRNGLLTEICGEASAGKTQLCLQLLLQCCLPPPLGGLGSSACYVSTESVGSVKRLHDLAQVYASKFRSVTRKRKRGATGADASEFLEGIFVEQIYTADELVDMLVRLPKLLEEQGTKLVIIDSIAAVFRLESTASIKEASERSRAMFHLANCMRILSAQYGAIFVVTNQVTGDFNGADAGVASSSSAHKPALGLSWANCINQRLLIRRSADASRRRMEVVFSPLRPPSHAFFEITSGGVRSPTADP